MWADIHIKFLINQLKEGLFIKDKKVKECSETFYTLFLFSEFQFWNQPSVHSLSCAFNVASLFREKVVDNLNFHVF